MPERQRSTSGRICRLVRMMNGMSDHGGWRSTQATRSAPAALEIASSAIKAAPAPSSIAARRAATSVQMKLSRLSRCSTSLTAGPSRPVGARISMRASRLLSFVITPLGEKWLLPAGITRCARKDARELR